MALEMSLQTVGGAWEIKETLHKFRLVEKWGNIEPGGGAGK